jgi:thiol-disulfide isomerase/thioredoxin
MVMRRTVRTVRTVGSVRSVFTVLTVLTVPTVPLAAQLEAGIKVGSKAPAVVINDLEGKPVDLGSVLGKKAVLLEFWATWCALCKGLLPELDKVHRTFGDKVALYGVNVTVNDSKGRVQRYLTEHRPPFQVLYDEKGAGVRAYDVPATSFIVVVDGSGKVVYTGSGEKQDLVGAVRKAVGTP